MSYDDFTVPDAIEPMVGYRGWLVKDGRLYSCYRDEVEWPIGIPLVAECIRPTFKAFEGLMNDRGIEIPARHWNAPMLGCTCGLYALNKFPKQWEVREGRRRVTQKPWPSDAVVGLVKGWGHLVVGDKGFRAQYMQPTALVARPRSKKWPPIIEDLAERYELDIVSVEEVRKYGHRAQPA